MSEAAIQTELLQAAVSRLPADGLSAIRGTALERFAASGFPTTRHEDWKYTNLGGAAALSNDWLKNAAVEADTVPLPDLRLTERIDAHWIVIRNGVLEPDAKDACAEMARHGVSISRLSSPGNDVSLNIDDPLSAFNAALLLDGLHIRVRAGAELDKPVGILHFDDGTVPVTQVRVLVDAGANSSLQIVEGSLSGGDGSQFQNAVMQVDLAEGAALDVVRIQERAPEHLNVNRMTAILAADARLDYNNFDFGGRLVRNDLVADIEASGASVVLRGLYLAGDGQHIDNHTRVDHRVGPATSDEEYRGILGGRSRCVFNGKAVVHAGADGTDANQSNHNLLLSDTAEIDTKPELEIYADDVKCSHGATVGQVDRNALFYLRSRGLDADEAMQILTRAFASVVPLQLPVEGCRDYLAAAIDDKLDSLISEKTS